jgi:hypothetical protein
VGNAERGLPEQYHGGTNQYAVPASALADLARAVPTDVVRDIVRDNCPRAAPTPPAEPSLVDRLVARFGPKAS